MVANEKRLIDANALLAELDKFVNPMPDTNGLHFLGGLSTAITEIEDALTVDTEEVVRCKDCNEYDEETGKCYLWLHKMESDDFCSYGERREGE